MKIRPLIKPGDVVKLSKKGRAYQREFDKESTLVVSRIISGNGSDRESVIRCRVNVNGSFKVLTFYRSELWFTGKNVFHKP